MFSKILTERKISNRMKLIVFLCVSLLNFACTPRAMENKNAAAPPVAVEEKQSSFESDLQTMRTANFEYVFVFRRKDGGEFDSDDRKYLRTYSPAETNRFVSTDGGKAFIAGSKYKFPPENLETLRLRFNVEDFSAVKE